MIHDNSGDMFKLQCQAYVNPVNTVGVAGKGLALTFKRQFPNNYEVYRKACFSKELTIGKVVLDNLGLDNPQYIISFPTKEHWANFSKYEYIQSGLIALVNVVVMNNIQSVAIPAFTLA